VTAAQLDGETPCCRAEKPAHPTSVLGVSRTNRRVPQRVLADRRNGIAYPPQRPRKDVPAVGHIARQRIPGRQAIFNRSVKQRQIIGHSRTTERTLAP
jgi:hypothetical protein